MLEMLVGWLAASLLAFTIFFYVVIYTMWLKRSTPQNIVIGGAAGCVPVLVAWAAVTGEVGLPALVLFAIVFYWTPPHFWALALRYRGDYAAARVPMLPVVRGEAETARQIVLYTIALVAVSLLLFPAAGMGMIYLVAASRVPAGGRRRQHHPRSCACVRRRDCRGDEGLCGACRSLAYGRKGTLPSAETRRPGRL